jgi:hypothetical protein
LPVVWHFWIISWHGAGGEGRDGHRLGGAPFVADPGRRSLLPLTAGSGSRVIRLQRYLGDYEIQFQCLGIGAAAYQLDAIVQWWRCGEPIFDEKNASGEPLGSLRIRAARSQRWRVLVQAGHTPLGK